MRGFEGSFVGFVAFQTDSMSKHVLRASASQESPVSFAFDDR